MHGVDNVGTVPAALTAYLALEASPGIHSYVVTASRCHQPDYSLVLWSKHISRCLQLLRQLELLLLSSVPPPGPLVPFHQCRDMTFPQQALRPDLIISVGTAGGFAARGAAIGDVFVATGFANHDRRIPLPVQ